MVFSAKKACQAQHLSPSRASPALKEQSLEQWCINTVRVLSVDAVEKANSGHPGTPMDAAPMAHVLWSEIMRYNPASPEWPNRDRFILSCGHACMLQYSYLYLTGYGLTLDDIKQFRQLHSKTPGHPEYGLTPGIEVTTGPLGQGFANAVGFAIAQRHMAARFNKPGFDLFNYRIYGICSDGDMMEGISSEAASLAGHLQLGNLIFLYDDNHITIEGNTDITYTEDVENDLKPLAGTSRHCRTATIPAISARLSITRRQRRPALPLHR